MDLKSKPLYGDGVAVEVVRKLTMFCQPVDFNDKSTVFNMGYEQAKRDVLRLMEAQANAAMRRG